MFEWVMNWCVTHRAHSYLIIHAAVLERHGRAVVLPAPPGSGKSTLCAALVTRGWRLLSDEMTLVRLEDGAVLPLPRPVSLKNGSIDVIRAFAPDAVLSPPVENTTKGTIAHLKAPPASIARADPARPAFIVFPRYEAGPPPALSPLPKARAFMSVAENAFNYQVLGVRGFTALGCLIERRPVRVPLQQAGRGGGPVRAPGEGWRMTASLPLLLRVLREPGAAAGLDPAGWDLLLRQALGADMSAILLVLLEDAGLLGRVPAAARTHLEWARAAAARHAQAVRYEVMQIGRALSGLGLPLILLKGAAYAMAGMEPGRGRMFSDIDILVPKAELGQVEAALMLHGWARPPPGCLRPALLPRVDARTAADGAPAPRQCDRRAPCDPARDGGSAPGPGQTARGGGADCDAEPGTPPLFVLAPRDMVLHSAVHLFSEGEFDHGLREPVRYPPAAAAVRPAGRLLGRPAAPARANWNSRGRCSMRCAIAGACSAPRCRTRSRATSRRPVPAVRCWH
jgi:hypothetical protein